MRRRVDASDALDAFLAGAERVAKTRNIHRWKALPHQEVFLQSQTQHRILMGGNRAGKTETGTADDVKVLTRTHEHRNHFYPPKGYPVRMRAVGVDYDRGIKQILLPKFAQLLPPSALRGGSWETAYEAGARMLHLEDGSSCSFMSYEQDPDKFQGVSLHHLHLDEEPPKPIYDECVLRLVDTAGTMTITETPVQQLEWLQDEIVDPAEDGRLTDWEVVRLSTLDNTHLPAEELTKLVGRLTPDEARIRLQGEYTGGSLVFPEFKRAEPNVVAPLTTIPADWAIYESMDHGYSNPTAWLWTAVSPAGDIVTFAELYAAKVTVDEWADRVLNKRRTLAEQFGLSMAAWERRVKGTVGDPALSQVNAQTGITNQQAYALKGVYIATEGIVKARSGTKQNVGIDKMHTYLKRRPDGRPWWQITTDCPALADELRRARKPKQSRAAAENANSSEQIRDKDNHAIDAIKYLFLIAHDLRGDNADTAAQEAADAAANMHEAFRARGAVSNPLRVEDVRAAAAASHWQLYGAAATLED